MKTFLDKNKRKEVVDGHTAEELREIVSDRLGQSVAESMSLDEMIEWYNLGV